MLSHLSGEENPKLKVSNQFGISVEEAETGLARESAYFSAGKIDQLYLALRLAIVESIYHTDLKLPLIFDDSFVQFDSERMRTAFTFLIKLAREEGLQILFTTCHEHVLKHMEGFEEVSVLRL